MTAEFVDVDDFVDERFIGEFPDDEYLEEDEDYVPLPVVADVMARAALIVGEGWTQGRPFEMVDGKRLVCANGALWLATGFEFTDDGESVVPDARFSLERHEVWRAAVDALNEHVGQPSFQWNDSIGQTKQRVVDTMLKLAGELREKAQ